MKAKGLLIVSLTLIGPNRVVVAALPAGYHAKVTVSALTR
jgi:hypothetical protein